MIDIKNKLNYKPYSLEMNYDTMAMKSYFRNQGSFLSPMIWLYNSTVIGLECIHNRIKRIYYGYLKFSFNNPYLKEITEQDLKDYNEFIKNGRKYIPKDE